MFFQGLYRSRTLLGMMRRCLCRYAQGYRVQVDDWLLRFAAPGQGVGLIANLGRIDHTDGKPSFMEGHRQGDPIAAGGFHDDQGFGRCDPGDLEERLELREARRVRNPASPLERSIYGQLSRSP